MSLQMSRKRQQTRGWLPALGAPSLGGQASSRSGTVQWRAGSRAGAGGRRRTAPDPTRGRPRPSPATRRLLRGAQLPGSVLPEPGSSPSPRPAGGAVTTAERGHRSPRPGGRAAPEKPVPERALRRAGGCRARRPLTGSVPARPSFPEEPRLLRPPRRVPAPRSARKRPVNTCWAKRSMSQRSAICQNRFIAPVYTARFVRREPGPRPRGPLGPGAPVPVHRDAAPSSPGFSAGAA